MGQEFLDIPLSEMIEALRRELRIAQKDKDGRVHFEVQDIELELDVAVNKDKSGGVNLSVLSWTSSRTDRTAQRVKVRLAAHDAKTGNRFKINNERDF